MGKIRWSLVFVLALILVPVVGSAPASADFPSPDPASALLPPPAGVDPPQVMGNASGGHTDGDPDDIIEGNRRIGQVNGAAANGTAGGGSIAVGGVVLPEVMLDALLEFLFGLGVLR